MKSILRLVSFSGLGLMFVSTFLFATGHLLRDTFDALLLVGTVLWFSSVPFWMKRRLHHSE